MSHKNHTWVGKRATAGTMSNLSGKRLIRHNRGGRDKFNSAIVEPGTNT